ncbi:MAG: hypothetical protein CMP75_00075 [Flavobacteriales bacterium]|nr:hypothetical protein [Flavobacteriales bacterium]
MNLILLLFTKTLATLPYSVLIFFSNIGMFILHITSYRKSIIQSNLNNSFPNKSTQEKRRITKQFYKHFAQFLIEMIKMFCISKKSIRKRIQFKNKELIQHYYSERKDVILVLGHYGNWEWGLLATSLVSNHEMVGVYKPLSSSFWNQQMKKQRSKFGATLVSMKESVRYLLKKGNKPRLIGVIGDQTPTKNEVNYWTTFLNQETAVFSGTEKLAKKLNCPVMFVHIDKIKNGYYEMSFELITENPQTHPEGEITNLHTQKLEEKIKERPEFWLWSHRRWKHSRT